MNLNRNTDFDLLRALIIFSAFVLHYNSNIYIGFLAKPSWMVQKYFFTVGGFFFFTAGYMAKKVYLERFLLKPKQISKKLFIKGLTILALYLFYVFIMHIFTETKLPNNLIAFIYDHKFFTKVLFTFSLLFMFTPIILLFYVKSPKLFIIAVVAIAFLVLFYNHQLSIPVSIKKMFIDRKLFLYPLIPSLFVYSGGFFFANFDSKYFVPSLKITIIIILLFCTHIFSVIYIETYSKLISNRNFFSVCEIVFPCLFLILFRYLISSDNVKKVISSPYVLCIGILSLHFYVISNLMLGLLSITKESEPVEKIIGLVGVASLSYVFTFWRFQSKFRIANQAVTSDRQHNGHP